MLTLRNAEVEQILEGLRYVTLKGTSSAKKVFNKLRSQSDWQKAFVSKKGSKSRQFTLLGTKFT